MDGAIDVAGMLYRAGVPASSIAKIAMKLRSIASLIDPAMQKNVVFDEKKRHAIAARLESVTDEYPTLHGFVDDCLEHVHSPRDLRAFYLHLAHIGQMVQLLSAATHITQPRA